jgi:hypothetical protein
MTIEGVIGFILGNFTFRQPVQIELGFASFGIG